MYWDVIDVQVVGDRLLHVTFRDGSEGDVEFDESVLVNVLEKLRDPAEFSKVMLINNVVTWPGEIDIAPDAMYEGIKTSGHHVFKLSA
jgi:hypothetical protein